MSNQYLERTPTSTGNRSVWTWAGWTKITDVANTNSMLGAYHGGSSRYSLLRLTSNKLTFFGGLFTTGSSTSYNAWVDTIQSIRDAGGWMHIMVVYNTTNPVTKERVKIYLNGVNVPISETASPGYNTATYINSKYPHYIGTWADSSNNGSSYYDGEFSDLFLVDGQALTPDVFGFNKEGDGYISVGSSTHTTDFRPGQWVPHSPRKIKSEIERRGGFGANGYYLPMNDSSNFGADFHTTPNSIIKLKGEDLPQPQNGAPTTTDNYVSQVRKEIGGLGFAGCVKFDGTGDFLQTTAASCWSASGDCTFECFIYPTTFSVQQGIFHTGNTGDFCLLTDGRLRVHPVASNYKDTKGAIPLHAWSHIALVQSSSNQRKVFINGVEQAFTSSGSPDSSGWNTPDGGVYIGDDGVYRNFFNGFMSNVRVIKGTALYTANFTPPTKPLTNVTNTKLLCCNSSTSATASTVTPGTITANGDPFATTSEITGSTELAVPGISIDLITNGTFDSNTTGWTASNAVISSSNGTLKVDDSANSGGWSNAFQVITTVAGRTYTLEVDVLDGNDSRIVGIYQGTYSAGSSAAPTTTVGTYNSAQTVTHTFTATGTSVSIMLVVNNNGVVYYDNVKVYDTTPRDYSANVRGSGTNRTATTVGSIGVVDDFPSHYGSAIDSRSTQSDALHYNVDGSGSNGYGTGDFTFECWFYGNSDPNTWGILMQHATNTSWANGITLCSKHGNDRKFNIYTHDGSSAVQTVSPLVWTLDQWHHVVAERHNGLLTLYVNGVAEATRADTRTYNVASSSEGVSIGSQSDQSYQSHGYFQDVRVYKGVAKHKGGFDVNKPYTPVGIESWRQVSDTCKNNFCTWNSLTNHHTNPHTLTDGNLRITNAGYWRTLLGTHGVSSGKWYYEMKTVNDDDYLYLGWGNSNTNVANYPSEDNNAWAMRIDQPKAYHDQTGDNTQVALSPAFTQNDICGVAFDADNGRIWWSRNGVWLTSDGNNNGNPAAGTGAIFDSQIPTGVTYHPIAGTYTETAIANFGQNPSFSGQVTAGTNTDSNGRGLFKYAPPTGFLALCDDNLSTPAIKNPGEHFKTVLYGGDDATGRRITGVGFQPDLVWVKHRNTAGGHGFYDSVRGVGLRLDSQSTAAESAANGVMSFDSDGFSLGATFNTTNINTVAWCWKAGGPALSNNYGSITTQVSANRTAGFSIVTGTQTNGTTTFGHGLDKAPEFIVTKQTNGTTGWYTWHKGIPITETLRLDNTTASTSFSHWVTEPTDSVFSMGSGFGSGEAYVAYCWHGVEGYSKIGSYTGNGSADGPFVYCGFKPAFLMIKRTDTTGEWWMYDSSRGPTNPIPRMLLANATNGDIEDSSSYLLDFLSNGFKWRSGLAASNGNGGSFIFIAFAESPFQTANAK